MLWSAWVKLSNILPRFFGEMPMPVSITSMRSNARASSCCTVEILSSTLPLSVNLMALPTRLISTCCRCKGSPRKANPVSGLKRTERLTPFFSTCGRNISSVPLTSLCRSKSVFSETSLPLSIFDRSRMLSINFSSNCADCFRVLTSVFCSSSSRVLISRSLAPITPLSGVRIS